MAFYSFLYLFILRNSRHSSESSGNVNTEGTDTVVYAGTEWEVAEEFFPFLLAGELKFVNTAGQAQIRFTLHSKSHNIGVQCHISCIQKVSCMYTAEELLWFSAQGT